MGTHSKGNAEMRKAAILRALVNRNIKLRYKQTLGRYSWAILQPLAVMLVFTILFNKILQVDSPNTPYPLFCFAGLMPWAIFSTGLMSGVNSLVTDSRLIRYSRIPRIFLPLSATLSPLADFGISLLILLGLMLYWSTPFSVSILAIIPLSLLTVMFSFGLSLWLSAINIQYRDVGLAMPFIISMAMLVSPIAYSTSLTENSQWAWAYAINPMAGTIEGFRWALLSSPFPAEILWKSGLINMATLITGLWFFSKREPIFADVA